jgi:GntR family transcriptional regulator
MSIHLDTSPAIDRTAAAPLYHQLKQWLSTQIVSGELKPGTQLPGDYELSERLGVSRGVVRQALSELRHDGLIERERGRGTFVSKPKTAQGLIASLRGLAEDAALNAQRIESTVLRQLEEPAGDVVAAKLHVEPGTPVVELERLRTLDGEPWVLTETHLPAALVPGLVDHDFSGGVSLYAILREEYGLVAGSATRRVEASVTDARDAHLLRMHVGAPLLVLRSVSFGADGRPFEYFVARHRGDRSAFEVRLP